jgi:hypothetical protein
MRDDRLSPAEEERLSRYVAGEMEPGARARFEREVLADGRLAEALYADVSLAGAIGAAEDEVTRARARRAAWPRWGAAAAAVLVVALLVPRLLDTTPSGRRLRSPEPPPSALRLAWPSSPQATSYRIEILDRGGAVVFSAETPDTSFVLPSAALSGRPRSALTWRSIPLAGATELAPPEARPLPPGR